MPQGPMDAGRAYDTVVIGSGVGGLFTGALLATAGERVAVLERHYAVGGYGHSFTRPGGWRFCAELHYVFNCGPGQDAGWILQRLGLADHIAFTPLNPDGFDRIRFGNADGYDIVTGLGRNVERLASRYPAHRSGLQEYAHTLDRLTDELYDLPPGFNVWDVVRHPLRWRHVVGYRGWTLQRLFDRLRFPLELQAILAGQSMDIALPPAEASLLIHAGNATSYDRCACVPRHGFERLFDAVADNIAARPGCAVRTRANVVALKTRGRRVTAAVLKSGEEIAADRFIYNGDPALLPGLIRAANADARLPRWFQRRLDYDYSTSSFSIYLGLAGIDLAAHGFGNWNVWHYPVADINRCYDEQIRQQRMDDPMVFLSTPTLHGTDVELAPPGGQQLVLVTMADFDYFRRFAEQGRPAYRAEKERVADRILDVVERHYVPGLRQHIVRKVVGTPLTNRRYVLAPAGNCYGQALTPANIRLGRIDYRTPWPNLVLAGATAGVPSFGGGLHYARLLAERLAR
ncbi:MAG: phytoene desaturase family protein [Planctomycetota bacterium]